MAHSAQDVVVSDIVERQVIINDACSKFVEIGFLSEMFTIRKIHENGYNDKHFLELIKPLYLMEDQEELKRLTASTPKNDLVKFMELMEWLKTEEGIQSIYDAYTRISKKNVVMTEEVVALAHKLVGYGAAQRLTHENNLGEINKLTRCLRELEKKSSDIEEDLKMNLGPLYKYKEPSLHELRILAYKLYEDDCKVKRIPAFPIDHEKGFEIATQKFGVVAKNLHLRSYLNDPIRKERIEKHFKERSFRFVAGDEEEEGGGGNRGSGSYEPQQPVVDSLSSSETGESYVPDTNESVPDNDHASDVSTVESPDSKMAQTDASKNVSDEAQSKRNREHIDMSEGVSNEPQDSEGELSGKKTAIEDSEKPATKKKKKT
ncbi:hypothetical protein TSUD_262320 [Trifolium subterraneum]|nr:hypothetical protein TSUD_262320 [Trifolium subterraneum]